MNHLKPFLIIIILLTFSNVCLSQSKADKDPEDCEEVEIANSSLTFSIGADLMSRYVWRGLQYGGNAPSIQPNLCLTWKGLNVGFWGAYSTAGLNESQELDFFISYTFAKDMFTVLFTDYYFPNRRAPDKFYNYDVDSTHHILEGTVSFNGTEKIPLSLLVAVNFYGADASRIGNDPSSSDFNKKVGIQYSTYMELKYSTSLLRSVDFDAFVGVNLTSPRKEDSSIGYVGEGGFYGSKAGVVNMGVSFGKEIPLSSEFSLPITSSIIANPVDNFYYFVFGVGISN